MLWLNWTDNQQCDSVYLFLHAAKHRTSVARYINQPLMCICVYVIVSAWAWPQWHPQLACSTEHQTGSRMCQHVDSDASPVFRTTPGHSCCKLLIFILLWWRCSSVLSSNCWLFIQLRWYCVNFIYYLLFKSKSIWCCHWLIWWLKCKAVRWILFWFWISRSISGNGGRTYIDLTVNQ